MSRALRNIEGRGTAQEKQSTSIAFVFTPKRIVDPVAGGRDGQFVALDARDGKLLWDTNLGPSVSAGPMTFMVNGKQYVSIQCGAALFTFALK